VTPNSSNPETLTVTFANTTANGTNEWVYPTSYGMDVCAAHDLHMHPYCADTAGNPLPSVPPWCNDHFCFVDQANCGLNNDASAYFPGSGLRYSYETCGSTNSFLVADGTPFYTALTAAPANPLHVFVWTGLNGRTWRSNSVVAGNHLNRAWDPATNNDRCIECPLQGMKCSGGVARPAPGFHEIAMASTGADQHFFACHDKRHCVGLGSISSSVVGSCAINHSGIMCASCISDYGMQDDTCQKCEGVEAGRVLLTIALLCGSMGLLLALMKKLSNLDLMQLVRCGFQRKFPAQSFLDGSSAGMPWKRFDILLVITAARILVSYGQVISLLGEVLNVRYPGWFGDFVEIGRSCMEPLQWIFKLLEPADCMTFLGISVGGFHARWVLNVIVQPIVFTLVLVLLKLGIEVIHKFWPSGTRVKTRVASLDLNSGLFLIMFFCYPKMLALSAVSFICTVVVPGTGSWLLSTTDGHDQEISLLDADDKVFCEDTEHIIIQFLSVVILIVIGCVIPLGFARALWKKSRANVEWRRELRVKDLVEELSVAEWKVKTVAQAVRISTNYGFMIDTYKPSYIWWESVECGRKLAMVVVVLSFGRRTTSQLIVAIVISASFLLLQFNYWPHKDRFDNWFKAMTELHIFWVVLSTLALKRCRDELAQEVLDSDFYKHFMLISFVVLIPLGLVVTVACKMHVVKAVLGNKYEGGAKEDLRRAFDMYLAGVPTVEHREILNRYLQGWHVGKPGGFAAFLSHYKNEAGDAAAMLHNKLVSSMPGLKEQQVFLDSNNLDNLKDIPDHVSDSDAIVLLLTPEVLSRAWCLVELYAAVEERKPIIVLEMGAAATGLHTILDDLPKYLAENNASAEVQLDELGLPGAKIGQTLREGLFHPGRFRVLEFNAQAPSEIVNAQASMLTTAIAEMTGGENVVLAQMNELHGAVETTMGLEAHRCICVVNSSKNAEVAKLLKDWLLDRTDLIDGQVVLLNEQPKPFSNPKLSCSEGDVAELSMQMSAAEVSDNIIRLTREKYKVAAVIMLQTDHVLKDSRCVAHLYELLKQGIPLVSVALTSSDRLNSGLLYRFEANKALMQDLRKNGDDFVSDLKRICPSVPIDTISATLIKRIPYTISKQLHIDNVMSDIKVMPRAPRTENSRRNRESVELDRIVLAVKGCLEPLPFHDTSMALTRTMSDDDMIPTRRRKRILTADIQINPPPM
jgi:hypothetical protein